MKSVGPDLLIVWNSSSYNFWSLNIIRFNLGSESTTAAPNVDICSAGVFPSIYTLMTHRCTCLLDILTLDWLSSHLNPKNWMSN